MKISELERKLKKNKCYLIEHRKNHDLWYSEKTGKEFTVPRHKTQEVPIGTLNSILNDAGIE